MMDNSDTKKGIRLLSQLLIGSFAFCGVCLFLAMNVAEMEPKGADALAGTNTKIAVAKADLAEANLHDHKAYVDDVSHHAAPLSPRNSPVHFSHATLHCSKECWL